MNGTVTSSGGGCFQWTIDDFLSVDHSCIQSPVFCFAGGSHYIYLCCHRNIVSETDKVELVFNNIRNQLNLLHVKLGMRTGMKGKQETRSGKTNSSGVFQVRKWMTYTEMLERRCEILCDGRLIIYCELTLEAEQSVPREQKPIPNETKAPEENEASDSDSESEESVLQSKSSKKVLKGLKNLFDSAQDSDVVIKIQGKKFPAHRLILRMRSPVFNTMFSHDMVEKETGVVKIEDCDPLTFPDFLNHIYTGSTKHVCAENVVGLYTASDKYDMQELKEACALFMRNNFSVDTFCDVIALALRHKDSQLIKSATDFFCKAAREIIRTPKWHKFLHENTIAGNELFDKALSNSNNI